MAYREVKISHTYRETNHYGDVLVKYVTTSDENLKFCNDYREIIRHLVHYDTVVSSNSRLIMLYFFFSFLGPNPPYHQK